MDNGQQEDYESAISGKGFNLNDFLITEETHKPQSAEYFVSGTITIKRKSTNIEKQYNSGHGSSWPAEFTDDLNQGKFN